MKKFMFVFSITFLLCTIDILAQGIDDCGTEKSLIDFFTLGKKSSRPTLSGTVQYIFTPNFKIHYTLSGKDSTTRAWAESTAVYSEYCWRICNSLGWITPPPDSSEDGDDSYDIYIRNTIENNYWGAAKGEQSYSNPYTDGMTSFIEIYRDSIWRPVGKYDGLRSVIAHEFSHAIQFRYSSVEYTIDRYGDDIRWPHWWINENTAVYMEDVIYDHVNTLQKFRFDDGPDPLDSPHLPICYGKDRYQYSGALWSTFLHEYYNPSIVIKIWEKFGQVAGPNVYSGIDSALKIYVNSSLDEALRNYAVWRCFTGTGADNFHFSEASSYPNSIIRTHHCLFSSWNTDSLPCGPGSTHFHDVNLDYDVADVNFNGQDDFKWSVTLVSYEENPKPVEKKFSLNSLAEGFLQTAKLNNDNPFFILIPVVTDTSTLVGYLNYQYRTAPGEGVVVQFFNKIKNIDTCGKLLLYPSDEINSGDYRILNEGQSYTVKTLNERFEKDSIYKHKDWKEIISKFTMVDNFEAWPALKQIANFNSLKQATIRNELIDAQGHNFGTLQFRDPWYLHSDPNRPQPDSFFTYTVTTPFSPTGAYNKTTGGVFLNQGDTSNLQPPYYSARAPLKQVLGTRNFLWWSATNAEFANSTENLTGYDTKAVIFRQPNDIIKAVYKGNKMSSTNLATLSNSQRKVVYSQAQGEISIPMYAGYESGGYVWLTYSSNNGSTWQPEQTPGKGSYISLTPSHTSTSLVDVVCQSETDNSKAVHYMKWGPSGSSFNNTLETGISSSVDPKPVLGRTNGTTSEGTICAVWRGSSTLRCSFCDYYYPTSWNGPYNIPNTTSLHKNPSTSYLPNFTYYLTYDDGIKIYLRSVRKDGSNLTWTSPLVVQGSYESTSQKAQVESEPYGNYGKAHIVWEGDDGSGGKSILYQRFYQTGIFSGTWSDPEWWSSAVPEKSFSNPSVAVYSDGKVAITWEDGETVYKINYNQTTNTWSAIDPVISQAYSSNLITGDRRISIDNSKIMATSGINQPHNITFTSAKVTAPLPGPGIEPEPLIVESYRSLEIGNKTTQSKFSFAINSVEVVNTDGTTDSIGLTDIADDASTNASNIEGLINRLTSKEKVFSSSAKSLKIKYSLRTKNATKLQESADSPITIAFALKDRDTKNIIRQQKYLSVSSDSVAINKAEITIPISSLLLNKAIIIVPQISGLSKEIAGDDNYYKIIVNRHVIQKRKLLAKPQIAAGMALPTEYQLNQNYPNPFNPVTQISYALPEASHLMLKVYDMIGREVAVLVDGFKEVGYYEATWDATNIPSGVYFYRLQSGNFNSVKKMLLMR